MAHVNCQPYTRIVPGIIERIFARGALRMQTIKHSALEFYVAPGFVCAEGPEQLCLVRLERALCVFAWFCWMLSLRLLLMCIGAYGIHNANVSDLKVMYNVVLG
jgi:hypothetical protein